jgi:hypothetical protein
LTAKDKIIDKINITKARDAWFSLAFFFVLVFSYFFFFGGYILFFQEQQSLFLYSTAFINDFFIKPGGLLDFSGRFLTQFYISKFAGSLILAAILVFPGIILLNVNRRVIPGSAFSASLILIPSCLLVLMQTHYFHLMLYNLGFLFVLVYFMLWVITEKKAIKYLLLATFPLFFYLTGAYAVIFICLSILYNLLYIKGPQKYCYTLFLLSVAAISAVIFNKILLLQTFKQLLLFPLPFINDPAHKVYFWLLTGYLVLYPLICRLADNVRQVKRNLIPAGGITAVVVFSSMVILLITGYKSQTARVINLEKLVFDENWEKAIGYQEKYPSENLIGQYFYNIALSETDQLCDRLFYGPQDFGTGSLILEWSSEHLNWGAYSFYTTGLINEAQRWAYEEMVVYGLRPQNMKLLTKTSLLTGNYRLTEKYTGILENTLFYKTWAKKYMKMAADTSVLMADNELGKKIRIFPQGDFFIHLESPESNLPILVDEIPGNRRAFEYMMSWLLLGKNVDILVNNIRLMKNMGYIRIPRHIEEAILIYYNSQGVLPDLGGLSLSNETRARFDQYFAAYMTERKNPAALKEKMEKQFSNTFWYYFHFK